MDPWYSRPMPLHTSEYKLKVSLSDSKLKDHGSLVKERFFLCVSNVIMSPLTATLKCPHGTGEDTNGSEAVVAVECNEGNGGRKDHL